MYGNKLTKKGMPNVAESVEQDQWLTFPGDEAMHGIDPKVERSESSSVKLFSAIAWLVSICLFLLLALAGSAIGYVYFFLVPTSLSFASVHGFAGQVETFEKSVANEIEADELTRSYKKFLTPENPFPPRRLFFAITKPLGDYYQGRNPGEFQCRVTCSKEDCALQVQLFLRLKTKDKWIYRLLSGPRTHEFSVPASRSDNRLVAIGRVKVPESGKLGDLNQLILLEVVK